MSHSDFEINMLNEIFLYYIMDYTEKQQLYRLIINEVAKYVKQYIESMEDNYLNEDDLFFDRQQ